MSGVAAELPLISIIVPTYNYGRWLRRSLGSVASQGGTDFELIVVDDGSTDDTPAILAAFARTCACPLRILSQQNRGQGPANNRGAAAARGRYLLFFDADDELQPGALDLFRRYLAVHGDRDLVFGGYVLVRADGREKTTTGASLGERRRDFAHFVTLTGRVNIQIGAAIIDRERFLQTQFREELALGDDHLLFGHALALWTCGSFPDPVVRKFQHGANMSGDFARAEGSIEALNGMLFDRAVLPAALMDLRRPALVAHYLSLFHRQAAARGHAGARRAFRRALCLSPGVLLSWRNLRRFARSTFVRR